MKKLTYILLSLLFTSAYAQDYSDSILVNLTNTSVNAVSPWYNKPNNTTSLSLKYGASINAGATYSYYNYAANCSGYATNATNTEHWDYKDSLYYTISGLNIGDTMLTIRSLMVSEIDDPGYYQQMTIYVNNVRVGVSNITDVYGCGYAEVDSISVGSGESVRVTIKSAASNTDLYVNTIEMYWMPTGPAPDPEHCDTVTISHSSTIINDTVGAGVGAIDYTPSGGTAPYTYSWNSGTYTTQDLTGLNEGNYTIVTTDDSLCVSSAQLYTVINIDTNTYYSDTIQAEDPLNTLTSLTVQTGTAGYNGTGHVGDFDSGSDKIDIHYNVEGRGHYGFKFRMGGKDGEYELLISLNGGVGISYVILPEDFDWFYTGEVMLTLEEGDNTISVSPGWGDTYQMDEIVITKRVRGDFDYSVKDTMSTNSIATTEAKATYDFLKRNYGKYIISGYTVDNSDSIISESGVYYIKMDVDFSCYTAGFAWHWVEDHHEFGWEDYGYVDAAIAYKAAHPNAIIGAQWHWYSPGGGHGISGTVGATGEVAGDNTFYANSTDFSLAAALNPANDEYDWFIQDIDSIASQIQKLKDNGITLLFRPFHEMDGAWFWWGPEGEQVVRDAYDIMYDRLTNYHGLNNIIWVWGLNYSSSAWTPNDISKIDIATWDRYGEPFDYADPSWDIDIMRETFPNTLIGLGEVGSYPDPLQSYEHDKMYSFYVGWNEYGVLLSNSSSHIDYTFNSTYVLDASETGYEEPDPEPSIPTVLTGIVISGSNGKVYSKNGAIKVRE